MIKHVWFDMAGTLYKETAEFDVVHDALRYSTYAALVHQEDPKKAQQEYLALYDKHGSNSAVFTSLGMPSDYWQRAFESIDVSELIKPDEEVTSTLKALKEIVPISVFTNLKLPKTATLIKQLKIPLDDFTDILSGDDISERKPALAGFHRMIELSGVAAGEIMYVGDREKVDIQPAKQVGMVTCLLWKPSELADYTAQSFSALKDIIVKAVKS